MNENIQAYQQATCWVPTCEKKLDTKKCLPLSSVSLKMREIWLGLAMKPLEGISVDNVFFCDDHFQANVEFSINNVTYTQKQSINIPSKNMPERVCRTCNDFMHDKEPIHTMSTTCVSEVPKTVEIELKNTIVPVSPEPLFQVFRFCFSDNALPSDPAPLICGKCYDDIWLFFAYKKRAIEVEDILAQDFTPEEYGKTVLCRSCTTERCSNFFPLDKTTELGVLLQGIFLKQYSPDVVPLRVCLNCCNILNKINGFHKQYKLTEKIMKRRALLNAKPKISNNLPKIESSVATQPGRGSIIKKIVDEKLILANLMLQLGQPLRDDLLNTENWQPICEKLQSQGVTCNAPSLINTWKKLQTATLEKFHDHKPLSELEQLVLKYVKPSRRRALELQKSSPCRGSSQFRDGVIQWSSSSSCIPEIAKPPRSDTAVVSAPDSSRKPGRKSTVSPADKMALAKAMRVEFDRLSPDERTQRGVWKTLVERVAENHMKHFPLTKLMTMWGNIKLSANIHEKDGTDPVDVEVWEILKRYESEKNSKSPDKKTTRNRGSSERADSTDPDRDRPSPLEQHPVINSTHSASDGAADGGKADAPRNNRSSDSREALQRLVFRHIKENYKEVKRSGVLREHSRLWLLVYDRMIQKGFQLDKDTIKKVWTGLRMTVPGEIARKKNPSGFMMEVHRFLQKVKRDKKALSLDHAQPAKPNKPKIGETRTLSPNQSAGNDTETPSENEKTKAMVYLNRYVFATVKNAYDDLEKKGELDKHSDVLTAVFDRIYEKNCMLDRIIAMKTWAELEKEVHKVRANKGEMSEFISKVAHLMKKMKNVKKVPNAERSKKDDNRKQTTGKKRAMSYERDSSYKPNRSFNASTTTSNEEKRHKKSSSLGSTAYNGENNEAGDEEMNPEREKKNGSVQRWTNEEEQFFLSLMFQHMNDHPFWSKVTTAHNTKYERTYSSVKTKWNSLWRQSETKRDSGRPLSETDRKIFEALAARRQKSADEKESSDIDCDPDEETHEVVIKTLDEKDPIETPDESSTKRTLGIKRERDETRNVPETIDIAYEYVSLEDLEGPTWEMPPLEPMGQDENVDLVVSKVEWDENGEPSTSVAEPNDEDEDSGEEVAFNHRYVCAKDLEEGMDLAE